MPKEIETATFKAHCRICGSGDRSVLYKGRIRRGQFGNLTKVPNTIYNCAHCKSGFLDRTGMEYESSDYREMVDGEASPEHFYSLHDKEQADRIKILGTNNLRGKVIADIGCGAGSFLDLVKGYASNTIAVEPARYFHQELKRKKHLSYIYCQSALKDWEGKVDIAVSFAVIEHLDNPLEFLKEIKLLLKPGGVLLISTPNYDDWLIKFLPEVYAPFFYRYVHTWYFNTDSLQFVADKVGFKKTEIHYFQRFDLSNALLWIRDHRPTGLGKIQYLQALDGVYKHAVEDSGQSDFIYARLLN